MFADDIDLCQTAIDRWNPPAPVVEVGGLEEPTIADYRLTIAAMQSLGASPSNEEIGKAQHARYLQRRRPLPWKDYIIENPESGGLPVEHLSRRYPEAIGTIVCLSTLEHVREPAVAVEEFRKSLAPGGVVIVSVPWQFPYHPSPEDYWRFSPAALRVLFGGWEVLLCEWRLQIEADAGVFDTKTGRPQSVKSCAIVARRP